MHMTMYEYFVTFCVNISIDDWETHKGSQGSSSLEGLDSAGQCSKLHDQFQLADGLLWVAAYRINNLLFNNQELVCLNRNRFNHSIASPA
jgi:hypothetical protein